MFYNSGLSYNGIHSSTYDIFACQIDSSNIEGQLLKQSLNTDKTKKSQKSNLYDMNKDNLTFTLTIATENWTNDKKDNVIKWLFSDTTNYSPLISDDDINVVYYCKPISIEKVFFRESQGYLKVDFECNAPYGFNEVTHTYNLTTISTATDITVSNTSNVATYMYPEIEFTLASTNTGISLKNKTVNNEITSFTGLNIGETIYMNGERCEILSSLGDSTYRYNKHNGIFLRLTQGNNTIEVTGKCTLTIKSQYPILRM